MENASHRSQFSKILASIRDLAIAIGVLVYFMGYVYLYHYFNKFGVSMIATNVAPYAVFVYAYDVFAKWKLLTAGAFALAIFGTAVYVRLAEDVGKREKSAVETAQTWRMKKNALWPWRWSARGQLAALHITAIAVFILLFPATAWWATSVAHVDANMVFERAHEGYPLLLRVVMTQSGTEIHPTAEFLRTLAAINAAGSQGRAILVGEDSDRIFVVIGILPSVLDDPRVPLPGDRVVALEKAYVTVEERQP
jgi:hypothetical protein